jgi:phosphohistidine phosphatase
MKTLFLVRHGKSSWSHTDMADVDRPLLVKGENKSKTVAEKLIRKGVDVDLIICSHALRAHETAKIIAAVLKYPESKIRIEKGIYTADADALYHPLFDLPDDIDSVMLVGHNPSMTYFANKLLKENMDNVPTSGLIAVSLNIKTWHDVLKAKGKELFKIFPKTIE